MCITIPIILVIVKGELGSDRDALEILKYLTATPPVLRAIGRAKSARPLFGMKKASKEHFPDAFFMLLKKKNPATTYFPTQSLVQYHRRDRA